MAVLYTKPSNLRKYTYFSIYTFLYPYVQCKGLEIERRTDLILI